jgi:mRNA interferase RelE/StbE
MYKLIIKKSAVKELDRLPQNQFLKIDEAILSLKNDPHPDPQTKKLKGGNRYRLRAGDYRVVYTVETKEQLITIYKVRHRKEVYR